MTRGYMVLRANPDEQPTLHFDADFEEASVRFLNRMPPVENSAGKFSIQGNRLLVWVDRGQVTAPEGGVLDIAGTSFEVPDITVPDAPVVVQVVATGPIPAGLSMVDQEPLRLLTRAGQPVDLAEGRVSARARLDLRLKEGLKPSDVLFETEAELYDVVTTRLGGGRRMAADQLALRADNSGLQISGAATISGVPVMGTWEQPLGGAENDGSQFVGKLEISERFTKAFGIALPDNSLSGQTLADLTIDIQPDLPPAFLLESDLSGLSAKLAPLGWQISKSGTGALEIAGSLGDPGPN